MHWLAHTKKACERCQLPIIKKITGKNNGGVSFVSTAKSSIPNFYATISILSTTKACSGKNQGF